jgi:hypothetical protein
VLGYGGCPGRATAEPSTGSLACWLWQNSMRDMPALPPDGPVLRSKPQKHKDVPLHARQGAPLGGGWERGSKSRLLAARAEGATRKIHALADAKGRLLAIFLTGGEAYDCPVAERLIL